MKVHHLVDPVFLFRGQFAQRLRHEGCVVGDERVLAPFDVFEAHKARAAELHRGLLNEEIAQRMRGGNFHMNRTAIERIGEQAGISWEGSLEGLIG